MEQDLTPPHRRGSDRARLALAAVGGGLAVILVGTGAVLISGAASADTTSPPAAAPSGSAPAPRMSPPGGLGMPGGRFGMGALAGELGQLGIGPGSQPLHGTVVVEKRDGGYQTLAAQRGTASDVSATSLTVRSTDGYTATYVVNGDTRIGAAPLGNSEGTIADIKDGADVAVVATVDGDTSTAVRVFDLNALEREFGQFRHHFGRFDPQLGNLGSRLGGLGKLLERKLGKGWGDDLLKTFEHHFPAQGGDQRSPSAGAASTR